MSTDTQNAVPEQHEENPLLIPVHKPDSIYHGLTIAEQRLLARLRRGSKKVPKAVLKWWKKADGMIYAEMLKHCVQSLIHASECDYTRLDRVKVRMRLPFNYRNNCDKRLPRPAILGYDDWWVYVSFKVDGLIDYLHAKGHSTFTAKELRKELWAVRKEMDRLDWLNEWAIDLCWAEAVNEIVPKAVAIPRKDKGRIKPKRRYRMKGVVDSGKPVEHNDCVANVNKED